MYVYNISFAFFDNLLHTKKFILKKYKKCSIVQASPIQHKFKFLFHWKKPILGLYWKDFA